MDDMDWKAAMSSEIFREYVKNETYKVKEVIPVVAEEVVLAELDETQEMIKNNSFLRERFKKLQEKFAADPTYRSKFAADFVEGVMFLDLDIEE